MATEVKSWKANDGSLHENECAAATRDVELMVECSPLAENTPFARKLVDWLTANAGEIRTTLEAHERACPKAVAAAEPAEEAPVLRALICHQCGTVQGDKHNFRHIAHYIPAGIYFCHEHANFYDVENRGMGQDFAAQWLDQQRHFPTTAEAAIALIAKPENRHGR
jgi:hypothetical protein